ncbi:hypothetical protein EOD41_16120 [Mucilaginibacter limnophilus]|uniref:Uncharacterized protein n=1 Tax=Mucilaginibacter limnophilus TaxID=1932778 RepID=A0A437ML19_9SPHI|nr:hypothetical protein [Mucilaginibacter limnophilus]RVT98322.1 hypothetical protein EOD41_16120 [Mucilaginibacter limnophilus]
MKKLAFVLMLGIAGAADVKAQQFPKLKDYNNPYNLSPLFSDSLAKLPKYTLPKLQAEQSPALNELYTYDKMPYVKPRGNYKTPVVDPATPGVRYTMLVKKIGNYQQPEIKLP